MAEVYVTLGEAAELERVKYNTMVKRVLRKQESFVTKTEKSENGGKDVVLVAVSSLSKQARNACGDTDYWKEIMIKDDMMKLDRVTIKASFVDCEPQDVIRYVLACAGIEDYVLSDEHYGKKDLFVIDRKSGINTIAEVNSSWGIKNPFFFQKKVFYWGTKEEQKEIYVLEEGETILSLNKYGDLWEAETIAIPWIHHSQEVEVQHSKYSGIVTVEKTIVRSDDTGAVHMYIYFAGGEKDV